MGERVAVVKNNFDQRPEMKVSFAVIHWWKKKMTQVKKEEMVAESWPSKTLPVANKSFVKD